MAITKLKLLPRSTLKAKVRTGFAGSVVAGDGILVTHADNEYTVMLDPAAIEDFPTSPVSAVEGGTGQTSYTVGDILYASTTTALSKLNAGTSGYALMANGAGVAPSYQGFAQPLTGGATRTWLAKGKEIISVTDFAVAGVVGDAAFQAAATAANAFNGTAGTAVYVPAGNYSISTEILVTDRVTWYGDGQSTQIITSHATNHVFNVTGGAATICDLKISSTVQKSAGAAIKVTGGCVISNVHIVGTNGVNGMWNGVEVDGAFYWWVTNCKMVDVINDGVLVYGNGDIGWAINTTVEWAGALGSGGNAGFEITSSGDDVIFGCQFIGTIYGMKWAPATSKNVLSMQAINTICDHNRIGLQVGGDGTSARNYTENLQVTSCTEEGVKLVGTGPIDGLELVNFKCHGNGTSGTFDGVNISVTTATNVDIRGATIAQNTRAGVRLAANVNKVTITDSTIGPWGQWTANASGVVIDAGTSTNITIADSNLSGNTSANLTNAATGTDVRVINCKGADGVLTPSQITANQNDYAPTGIQAANIVELSSDAVRQITGIVAPAYNKPLMLLNRGGFRIDLIAGSGSSSAANRFAFAGDIPLRPNEGVGIVYNTAVSQWLLASFALPAGVLGVLNTNSSGTPTVTATPTLGASGTLGSVTFGNATSGTITLQPEAGALGTRTLLMPAASDTLVGRQTIDTLQNKTINTTNGIEVFDSGFTLDDNSDSTKKLQFQLSGITTGTTRTLTVPDANTTIVGHDATQTLTNKTFALGSNTLSGTTAQFNSALSDGDFATLAGTEELDSKTLDSSVGKGTWTASGTWTLPAFTLGGTVSGNSQTISSLTSIGLVDAGSFFWGGGATTRVEGNSSASTIGFVTSSTTRLTISTTQITAAIPVRLPSYTVAGLPSGAAGDVAFATNLRVFNGAGTQEGAGVGTGGVVHHNGTAWKIAGTNVTAVA